MNNINGMSMRWRSSSIASTNLEQRNTETLSLSPSILGLRLVTQQSNSGNRGQTTATDLSAPPTPLDTLSGYHLERHKEGSLNEETLYTAVPSRNPSLFKALPSLPVGACLSPDLQEASLSPHPSSAGGNTHFIPTVTPPPRSKFSIFLPKLPRLRTSDYLKAITFPSSLNFRSVAKPGGHEVSASTLATSSQHSRLPSLKIQEDANVIGTPGDAQPLPERLVSPAATGFLYPRREDYSFDPSLARHTLARPPPDHRTKSAPDIRHRNRKPGPNQSLRLPPPLLRSSTTPNVTDKFPIPRAVSFAARTESERSNADMGVGSGVLYNLGIESIGRWTGFKWVLLVSVLTVRMR
jgi:hypothetical protein